VFDLAERCLRREVLYRVTTHAVEEEANIWLVRRGVGGLGLAHPGTSEYWGGIWGVKARSRRRIMTRLVERGELIAADVGGLPDRTFFLRTEDLPQLHAVRSEPEPRAKAALVGALDNLLWDRNLLRWIFDFDFVWEVYKPAHERVYGYYVLPLLYGDRFVARLDPAFDHETRTLRIKNWWWEDDVHPDNAMRRAVVECFQDFMRYLGADEVRVSEEMTKDPTKRWLRSLGTL
jgi:uncharacterized protein YcaQ